jgi:hypothetical protein
MRTRRCSICRKKVPAEDALIGNLKAFCSIEHLIEFSRSDAGKKIYKTATQKDITEAKERLKPRSDRMREAQSSFNRYIRARDMGKPCICCGRSQGDLKIGGAVDAGHYRSRGSAPGLKFNVFNCHSQLAYCNRYLSGNVVSYRARLIEKIGLDRVERLESDNSPKKFDAEYLDRVKRIFSKRAKMYERKFRQSRN